MRNRERSRMGVLRETRRRRGTMADRGFTILEVVIACTILFIGIIGVLSLFPAGIATGRKVVQDSTAITIARSVADGIRAGIRNNLRYRTDRGGVTYTYFIFHHDGVKHPIPNDESQERHDHDYYILLPRHRPEATFSGGRPEEARIKAVQAGKVFVYPESDPDPDPSTPPGAVANGSGDPFLADNDADDYIGEGGYRSIRVREVYRIGAALPEEKSERKSAGARRREEALKQYSYAFEIRQSKFDTDMLQYRSDNFKPGNELYHVRIMVFRAFPTEEELKRPGNPGRIVEPVFELEFEVAR